MGQNAQMREPRGAESVCQLEDLALSIEEHLNSDRYEHENIEVEVAMSENEKGHVSRLELYLAFLVLWIYNMFILGEMIDIKSSWAGKLFLAISFIMVIGYMVAVFRVWTGKSRKKEN